MTNVTLYVYRQNLSDYLLMITIPPAPQIQLMPTETGVLSVDGNGQPMIGAGGLKLIYDKFVYDPSNSYLVLISNGNIWTATLSGQITYDDCHISWEIL